jgi:hypothetical protein
MRGAAREAARPRHASLRPNAAAVRAPARCAVAPRQHMVFMGSERFPDENSYDAYLQQHGARREQQQPLYAVAAPGGSR